MRVSGQNDAGGQTSGRIHSNPGARLLDAARDLFYEQGYATAGINEINARSGTSKKSIYNYFPSKQKRGEAYLGREQAELFDFLDALMRRHRDDYRAFVRAWAYALKKAAGRDGYFGCPFANTAAQTGSQFSEILAAIARELRDKLRHYLRECDLKYSPKKADAFAEQMLMQYQGAVQMWRLSGDLHFFDLMEETLNGLAATEPLGRKRGARASRRKT
ncbi:MAG: TetR/AcrR family transcriptional regulator [Leptospirales bacterium]